MPDMIVTEVGTLEAMRIRSIVVGRLPGDLFGFGHQLLKLALQADRLCHFERLFALILIDAHLNLVGSGRWRFAETEE